MSADILTAEDFTIERIAAYCDEWWNVPANLLNNLVTPVEAYYEVTGWVPISAESITGEFLRAALASGATWISVRHDQTGRQADFPVSGQIR